MECCGQDRTSKFCPECSAELQAPLESLLSHVKARLGRQLESVARHEQLAHEGYGSEYQLRRASSIGKTTAKWQTWADELEKAIAALAEKEAEDANDKASET